VCGGGPLSQSNGVAVGEVCTSRRLLDCPCPSELGFRQLWLEADDFLFRTSGKLNYSTLTNAPRSSQLKEQPIKSSSRRCDPTRPNSSGGKENGEDVGFENYSTCTTQRP
jgi:hypothetical protein